MGVWGGGSTELGQNVCAWLDEFLIGGGYRLWRRGWFYSTSI